MREVAVVGIGQTPIKEHWSKSLRELAGEAAFSAMQDANINSIDGLYVGNMMSGSANHQQQLGAYIADWIGMNFIEGLKIESACSSSSAAFRTAVMAVASGEINTAIALGVEKMTDSPGGEITSELATAADADWEVDYGISFVALNALIMQRYLYEYGWSKESFAQFAINAHDNGVHNSNARFQKAISYDQYIKSPVISDPITLLDASPIGDGAAAVVIVPKEKLNKTNNPIVKVIASSAATDTISVHNRKDPLWLTAAEKSSKAAYAQCGIEPNDIDIFEAHDAFTIMACLSLEACGFAERGKGPKLAIDGEIKLDGKIPISTFGGLKSRGHPVGATGLYQICEIVKQLKGNAGNTQVKNAKIGMTQNIGGSGSNIITHIFKSEN